MRAIVRSLALFVLVTIAVACSKEPNRWEAAEQRAEQAADSKEPTAPKVKGSELNAFFPAGGPNASKRVFTAEKDGYVEAKLQRDGQDIATLSISQAAADALSKFDAPSDDVAGFPLVTVGNNQSSVLVNKKYQVKVSSKELAAADRKALLATFNLKGLAEL